MPHQQKRQLASLLLSCLLLLGLLANLAARGVSTAEADVTSFIFRVGSPMHFVFMAVTQLGSIWFASAFTFWLLMQRFVWGIMLFLATSLSFITCELMKSSIGRPRPYEVIASISHRDPLTIGGYGFPSGHTAIATAVGLGILALFPSVRVWQVAVGVTLVGLSRIILGMHLPLDVLGGAAIGGFFGLLIFGPKLLANHTKKA